jgi:hypothetical protein
MSNTNKLDPQQVADALVEPYKWLTHSKRDGWKASDEILTYGSDQEVWLMRGGIAYTRKIDSVNIDHGDKPESERIWKKGGAE